MQLMHRTSILLKALVIEHASDDTGMQLDCQHYYPSAYECIGEYGFETTHDPQTLCELHEQPHMALRGIRKQEECVRPWQWGQSNQFDIQLFNIEQQIQTQ